MTLIREKSGENHYGEFESIEIKDFKFKFYPSCKHSEISINSNDLRVKKYLNKEETLRLLHFMEKMYTED